MLMQKVEKMHENINMEKCQKIKKIKNQKPLNPAEVYCRLPFFLDFCRCSSRCSGNMFSAANRADPRPEPRGARGVQREGRRRLHRAHVEGTGRGGAHLKRRGGRREGRREGRKQKGGRREGRREGRAHGEGEDKKNSRHRWRNSRTRTSSLASTAS